MEDFVNGSSVNVGYDGGELDVSVFVTGFWKINHFVTFHTLNVYS